MRTHEFSPGGTAFLEEALDRVDEQVDRLLGQEGSAPASPKDETDFESIRWRAIDSVGLPAGQKGAILALLGSIERTDHLVDRIAEERASVERDLSRSDRGAVTE